MSISGVLQAGILAKGCLDLARRTVPSIVDLASSIAGKAVSITTTAVNTIAPAIASGITSAPIASAANGFCSLYAVRTAYNYVAGSQKPKTQSFARAPHPLPGNNGISFLEITQNTPLISDRVNRDRAIPATLKAAFAYMVSVGYLAIAALAVASVLGLGIASTFSPLTLCGIFIAGLACTVASLYATIKHNMLDDTYRNPSEILKFILSAGPLGVFYYGIPALQKMIAKCLED